MTILAALLLAGCATPAPPEATPTPPTAPTPRLQDLARCDAKYPDGEPVDCADDAVPLAPSRAWDPLEWLCLDDGKSTFGTLKLYRNAKAQRLGLEYDLNFAVPAVSMTLRFTPNGSERVLSAYRVQESPLSGFLELPEAPSNGGLQIEFYHTALDTDIPDAALEQYWMLHADKLWPLHVIAQGDQKYFIFSTIVFNDYPRLIDVDLDGADFRVGIDVLQGEIVRFEYSDVPVFNCDKTPALGG